MKRICVLLMRLPTSEEEARRMLSPACHASKKNAEAAIYLLGEGVFWIKGLMPKKYLGNALDLGAEVKVSRRDLLARGISESTNEKRFKLLDDLEGELVDDVMGKTDRVVSW